MVGSVAAGISTAPVQTVAVGQPADIPAGVVAHDSLERVTGPIRAAGPFRAPLAPGEKVLLFAGSFGPPTAEHMGIVVRLMERYGFTKAVMMPTVPYKVDPPPPPAELVLAWCRTAAENVGEILLENGFGSQPTALGPGHAAWVGADGVARELVVSDYEIANDIKNDTLRTLSAIDDFIPGAAPSDVYMVSGADSFQKIPTWTNGDSRWQRLLECCNWLVVSRPGYEDKVDTKRRSPLAACLPADVIDRYAYSTDQNGVHHYVRTNGTGIAVVSNPTRDFSSTKVKADFKKDGDHDDAESMLQPSVFRACAQSSFFGDYDRVFTEKNFANYLRARYSTMAGDVASDPAFQEALDELIAKIESRIRTCPATSVARRMVAQLTERTLDAVNPKTLAASVKNALASDAGMLPAAYAIGEVLEWALRPVAAGIAYLVGGTEAAAAVGLASLAVHQEYVTLPAWAGYFASKKIQNARRAWRLADPSKALGSRQKYEELSAYAHKLSRGDAQRTVATRELDSPYTIGGGAMAVNLVKSQMFKWVPLAIRRLADAQVTWYDMNLSVNELRAILGNDGLDREIRGAAGTQNQALYAHALLAAIQHDEAAQLRLEIFAGQRYFRRLCFGDEPDTSPPRPMSREVIEGFTPTEQSFIAHVQHVVRGNLDGHQRELGDLITAAYLLMRTGLAAPEKLRDSIFWDTFVDVSLTAYPGRAAPSRTPRERSAIDAWLQRVITVANAVAPGLLAGAIPTYRGSPPASSAKADKTPDALELCAGRYFEVCGKFLCVAPAANRNAERPVAATNLSWRIEQARAANTHRHTALAESFTERLAEFGVVRDIPRKSRRVLQRAKRAIDDAVHELDWTYRGLQYTWLADKKALPKGMPVSDPERYEAAFAELEQRSRDLADRLSRITMTLAVDSVDLRSPEALQHYVDMLATMGSSYKPTTMGGNVLRL